MKIQCVICEQIEDIDADSKLGKKLRNHPLLVYLCENCHTRITEKTMKRKEEGRLNLPFVPKENEEW